MPELKTCLLLHHVSKDRNLETLQNLSSNFFNLDELILVGRRKDEKQSSLKLNDETSSTPQKFVDVNDSMIKKGTTKVRSYKYFREALEDLQIHGSDNPEKEKEPNNDTNNNITKTEPFSSRHQGNHKKRHILVGIEIEPGAIPANALRQTIQQQFPDCESVTFMPGNEGSGLLQSEKDHCDLFVYVQQFFRVAVVVPPPSSSPSTKTNQQQEEGEDPVAGGAGSLNVATSVAVCLSQFFSPSSSSSLSSSSSFIVDRHLQKIQIVPVLPFSVEEEKSRRAHFLCRPCTAFGSSFVAIVCPTHKVFMGEKGNRSSYGKNMNAELHCPLESYVSSFQALRDIRQERTNTESARVVVVGIELLRSNSKNNNHKMMKEQNHQNGSPSFTQQLEQVLLPLLVEQTKPITLALLFASPTSSPEGTTNPHNQNDDDDDDDNQVDHHNFGRLSESDKKFCDIVLNLPIPNRNDEDDHDHEDGSKFRTIINLPCFVSIVLHRLCLFFGFVEGQQQQQKETEENNENADNENNNNSRSSHNNGVNKFVVTLKQKSKQHQRQEETTKRKMCPLLRTSENTEGADDNDNDDSLFGGLL